MAGVKVGGKLGERARIRRDRESGRILPMIKEMALAEFGPDEDRDPLVIHPSEMAKSDWCIRATYYRISGKPPPDEKFNFVLETIFSTGNDAHEKYQRWLRATGKLYGTWECLACGRWWTGVSGKLPESVCVVADKWINHVWAYREVRMLPEGTLIAGRADGGIGDALVEIKTIGLGTLRIEAPKQLKPFYHQDIGLYDLDGFWKSLSRPLPSHVRQASIYLWLARRLGLPFTQMNFIYEFKPNQQTKEFVMTLSERVIAPLLDKAVMVETALRKGSPPPCEFGGCKQCKAYEEDTSDGAAAKPGEQGSDRKTRRVVTGGRTRGGEAAANPAPPSRRRTAAGAPRADRTARLGADGEHERVQPVGRISRRTVKHGPGG